MKQYKSATAFRTALEDRLRRRARESGTNPQRFWTLVPPVPTDQALDGLARLVMGHGDLFDRHA